MHGADQYCALQAHHCVAKVLAYLESVSKIGLLFPRAPKHNHPSKTEKLARHEELEDLRRQFALQRDRLDASIQLIQAACFRGTYCAACVGRLKELLAVLDEGSLIKRPEQAPRILDRARKLGWAIQDEATPLMSQEMPNVANGSLLPIAQPKGVVVRMLILSDLHCGMPDAKQLWPNVEDVFLRDLREIFGKLGPIDLVLFTGDMVYSGDETQFGEFNKILDKVWPELMKIGKNQLNPPLVTIPGNHDIAWLGQPYKGRLTGIQALSSNMFVDQLLSAEPTDVKTVVGDAHLQYWNWRMANLKLQKSEGKPALLNGYSEDSLLGDFSLTFAKEGRRLGVVGLNSAFRQLQAGDYKRRLLVDCRQLNTVCNGHAPNWAKTHDACLLVTHHPTDWFDDERKQHFADEIYRSGMFCLHIHGHMHEPNMIRGSEYGNIPMHHLQVPSLFGLEKFTNRSGEKPEKKDRTHGYCVLELTLGDAGLWFRYRTRVRGKPGNMIDAQAFDATIQPDGWASYTHVPKHP